MSNKNNRITATLILLASLFWSVSAATLQEVKVLIDSAHYQRALVAMRDVMDKPAYKNHATWNKYYGQCLCLTGEYEASIAPLQLALKKGQSGAMYYLAIAKQHMYAFAEGADLIAKYQKKYCTPNSEWSQRCDSILALCEQGQNAVEHVRDYVILDSLSLPENAFVFQYRLGPESGKYVPSLEGGITFMSALGDYQLHAAGDTIYETHRIDENGWEEWHPLQIDFPGEKAFPYMRSDGETLIFAAKSDDGLGGWDLYRTTRAPESEAWYTPERLPMPINSPFDDYAFGLDETNLVGWWATNRNNTPGFITIYLFQYDSEAPYLKGEQPQRGRIANLAESWKDPQGYKELVEKCLATRTAPSRKRTYAINIPINDNVTYHSQDDFKQKQARKAYNESVTLSERLATVQKELDSLREKYHGAQESTRKAIRPLIIDLEFQEENLHVQLAKKQKEFRNLELAK